MVPLGKALPLGSLSRLFRLFQGRFCRNRWENIMEGYPLQVLS